MADRWLDVDRLTERAAVGEEQATDGGAATSGSTRELLAVDAPFTGETIGTVPAGTPDDLKRAVERAREAQRAWAERPIDERTAVLDRYAKLVAAHREELLDLVQLETGKARAHALAEWGDVVAVAGYYADTAPSVLSSERREGALGPATRTTVHKHPIGVIGVIAPWNYPLTLAISDALPALVAGNAVVLKPAEATPFTALRLAELADEAGLPSDLLAVVPGTGESAGRALTEQADYLSFTGSTAVGRQVGATAGERLVGASLELGGTGPSIVLPGASLKHAVRGVVAGAFDNAGQLCIATERVYVHESQYEAFCDRLATAVADLSVGPGYDYDTDVGAMISEEQLQKVATHVERAVEGGAEVLTGGSRLPEAGPRFYEPTVVVDTPADSRLACEETFGPVVTVDPVASVKEAIERANDSPYGLHAAVYGDERTGERVASRLETGTVSVNDAYPAAWLSTDAPMGGRKDSGLGRRHGPEGLRRYTEPQTVATQRTGPIVPPERVPGSLFARGLGLFLRLRRRVSRLLRR